MFSVSSGERYAIEDADFLLIQLDPDTVGVADVKTVLNAPVRPEVLQPGLVEPGPGGRELFGAHRDRDVLHAADGLAERRVVVSGKVEEAEQVAVADVEEEVAGSGVVAVLHQLDQREADQFLVEADGLLDVSADQRRMVEAASGRRRPVGRLVQILVTELRTALADGGELLAFGLWHRPALPSTGQGFGTTVADLPAILELWLALCRLRPHSGQPQLQDRGREGAGVPAVSRCRPWR